MDRKTVSMLAGLALLPYVETASSSEPVPLVIASKEVSSNHHSLFRVKPEGLNVPRNTIRLTLRNDSTKVITAYHISGILDTGRGDFSLWENTVDDYYQSLLFGRDESRDQSPVLPGETVKMNVRDAMRPGLGAYSAQTIRVDAVLYADNTYIGDGKAVKQLLRFRGQQAAHLSELLESGVSDSFLESSSLSAEEWVRTLGEDLKLVHTYLSTRQLHTLQKEGD